MAEKNAGLSDLVEDHGYVYTRGRAFYEFVRDDEVIAKSKEIVLMDKVSIKIKFNPCHACTSKIDNICRMSFILYLHTEDTLHAVLYSNQQMYKPIVYVIEYRRQNRYILALRHSALSESKMITTNAGSLAFYVGQKCLFRAMVQEADSSEQAQVYCMIAERYNSH